MKPVFVKEEKTELHKIM